MMQPLCLVEPSLRVNPEALDRLRRITDPLHVVGIFGPKNTGKSFLMDQLAEQKAGFGSTPGIWMQLLPHPAKPGEVLVLLYTKGFLEQMDKGEEEALGKLVCLKALLCSVLIYNTRVYGELQDELGGLTYMKQLAVLKQTSPENSSLLSSVLPEFVWCLRDVDSILTWEEILQAADNDLDILLPCNLKDTLACHILQLFPSRKAFCFRCPCVDEQDWNFFSSDPLHPTFRKQFGAFKRYILSKGPKRNATGGVLCRWLEQLVNALSGNQPICLSTILKGSEAPVASVGTERPLSRREHGPEPPRGACALPHSSPPDHLHWFPPSQAAEEVPPDTEPPSLAFLSLAEASDMDAPVCLIENKPGEKLRVNREALQLLQSIHQPVVVVAIVGLYRTGKSYLMNQLAGKNKGFALGATVQALTKGIWMWCLPHPSRPDHTLVLLDTEGLGDVEKSNPENDAWIFALSILLCSTFVYNTRGTIDHNALEQLHYVTEITEHIKLRSSARTDTADRLFDDLAMFFPSFIWVVRDFTLQLQDENGESITEDEYLERALRRGKDATEKHDLPKKFLRQYFHRRKCFVFECPAERKDLERLEDLPRSKLNPEFLQQARRFCDYIFQNAPAKGIQGGPPVTGKMLGGLAETYVDAIRRGAVPCIENAVLALAQAENEAAVREGLERYDEMVRSLLVPPAEDTTELLAVHALCEEAAIQAFLNRAFRDENQQHQHQLKDQLQLKLEELYLRDEQVSLDRCLAVLCELFQEVEERISRGAYAVAGGYQRFRADQQEVIEAYFRVANKGNMASKALHDFLESKDAAAESILQADKNLTSKQKEMEAERARAEAAEREAQAQKKRQKQNEQLMQDMKRSHKEHKRQLMAKMEEDRKKLRAEFQTNLNLKLLELTRLQQEGHREEVARLRLEIEIMKYKIQEMSSSSCVIA